jgi:hypothetical protein|tara:strand:+ start:229 stop:993 length:765 start_codon:yes stop_codon:yes gene_type:complete
MDIEAVRKRLAQLQTTNTRTTNLWKPQPGKSLIRIVPYKLQTESPFIELFFHYDLGGKTYLSPISFGRPDPIEEFADKLKSSGNREDWRLGKKLEAKLRTFAPVVVRGEEGQGTKFWGFGKTVYQELLSIIADPDYGDIADPVNGRDVMVEFLTAEETGANFPKTNIRVKPNQTPITDNKALLETVLKEQKDIAEVYQELSYDELAEALNDWLNPSEDGDDSSTKDETVPASTLKSAVNSTSDAGSAFDDLFNS